MTQQNEQSRHDEDKVKSPNIQDNEKAEHDLKTTAPESTAESPRTINACGPSQDQVKRNMSQERSEGTTSPLEGGAPHLSRLEEELSSLEGRGTSLQSIHQDHQFQDGEMDLLLKDADDDIPSKPKIDLQSKAPKSNTESPMTIPARGPSQDHVMIK